MIFVMLPMMLAGPTRAGTPWNDDSSSPATAFAAHVKLIVANCNQNSAPDEVRFVGAMLAHGSRRPFQTHRNETQGAAAPATDARITYRAGCVRRRRVLAEEQAPGS
jgi:hypothetical protein